MGRKDRKDKHWQLNFGLRPGEELYDRTLDADCVHNLAGDSVQADEVRKLTQRMEDELKMQGDPRMLGNGKIFDEYKPTNGAGFYDKYLRGEKPKAGWIAPTDVEPAPLK